MKHEGIALAMITLALFSGLLLVAATSGCDSNQQSSPPNVRVSNV
jgi:hypothetical protein